MRGTGLVLGGGGSRGAYEIGVWRAARELGVKLSPGLAPKIKTLAQLADSLWEEMEKTCGETTSP